MSVPLSAQIEGAQIMGEAGDESTMFEKGLTILKTRGLLGQSKGQYVLYTLRVRRDGESYTVTKRFSEFAALHDVLTSRFGTSIPISLPSKTAVRYFSDEKLEDRKHALNAYLKEICGTKDYYILPDVWKFFNPMPGAIADDTVGIGASSATGSTMESGNQVKVVTPTPAPPPHRQPINQVGPGKVLARHDSEDDLVGWDT